MWELHAYCFWMEIPPDIQVDFMESQTSQQLEEQAPKIQNGWMIGFFRCFQQNSILRHRNFAMWVSCSSSCRKNWLQRRPGFFRIAVWRFWNRRLASESALKPQNPVWFVHGMLLPAYHRTIKIHQVESRRDTWKKNIETPWNTHETPLAKHQGFHGF